MADEAINAKAAFAAGDYETAAALFTQLLEEGTADDHLQLCNRCLRRCSSSATSQPPRRMRGGRCGCVPGL